VDARAKRGHDGRRVWTTSRSRRHRPRIVAGSPSDRWWW